jgi:molybdopterin/thiamine biosynthesis adenylyltransferase
VATFTKSELTRYSRHLILPEVGEAGQAKLKAAKVLVVGAGGLGSPVSMYLAAAGVGTIGLVDFDTIDLSNLQRQIIYSTADVGKHKVVCAAGRLSEMNPEITVQAHLKKLSAETAEKIIEPYDIVIDGTDNFPTRFLVNDACVLLGKPNVFGSIFRFEGHMSLFNPPHGPCYRCMFPKPLSPDVVPNCAEGGVLGVLAGTIGALQATEAVKWILQIG